MPRRFRNIAGPEIRRHRIAQALSQEQVAARLQLAGLHHLDRVAVAKVEGQIRSLYDWELMAIAEVLGVKVDDLKPALGVLKRELPHLMEGKRGT